MAATKGSFLNENDMDVPLCVFRFYKYYETPANEGAVT